MSKRIIGRTVGTNLNPDMIKTPIDFSTEAPLMNGEASPGTSEAVSRADHVHPTDTSRMVSAEDMAVTTSLANGDHIPIYSNSDKVMKKVLYGRLLTLIKGEMNALTDKVSGYKATLPSLSENEVIALASDITDALVGYYTKEEVNSMVSSIPKFDIKAVGELPTKDISNTTIYLLLSNPGDTTGQLYTEYLYVGGRWEKLGEQTVDLAGYATEEYVQNYVDNALGVIENGTY